MKILAFLLLSLAACFASAEVRPFESGSHAKIRAAHAGQAFILGFWSLDCPHCPKELKALGELKKKHPEVEIVLVSTDALTETATLNDFVARHGLGNAEQWVFADAQSQKLRFEIDKRWWGELPRTYLFYPDGKTAAFSGTIATEAIEHWLSRAAGHGRK